MTEEDILAVADIETLSFPQTSSPKGPCPLPTSEARLREELSRPWSHSWVIRGDDGRALSFLVAWHVSDEVHVLNVAASPTHRRRGMGSALVAQVIRFARAKAARHILLEVRCSNEAAIRMYRAAGFFATGRRRRYYPDDEDAVTMELAFDPRTGDILQQADAISLNS